MIDDPGQLSGFADEFKSHVMDASAIIVGINTDASILILVYRFDLFFFKGYDACRSFIYAHPAYSAGCRDIKLAVIIGNGLEWAQFN